MLCCLRGSYHQTDLSATDSFGYVLPWRGHSPARGPAQRAAAFFSSDVLNAGLVRGAGGGRVYCRSALGLAGQGPAEEAHGAAKDLAKDLAM